jgi:DNA-binding beta-propeller fold protein YncE
MRGKSVLLSAIATGAMFFLVATPSALANQNAVLIGPGSYKPSLAEGPDRQSGTAVAQDGTGIYFLRSQQVMRFDTETESVTGLTNPDKTVVGDPDFPDISLTGPLALTTDSKRLFVSDVRKSEKKGGPYFERNRILTIDTESGKAHPFAELPLHTFGNFLSNPTGFVVTPDDKTLYVAVANSVWQFDISTGELVGKIPSRVANNEHYAPLASVHGLALSPDGRFLYIASTDADTIVRVNRETMEREVFAGDLNSPEAVSVSSDGRWVYIGNTRNESILRVDVETRKAEMVTRGGDGRGFWSLSQFRLDCGEPTSLATAPDGSLVVTEDKRDSTSHPQISLVETNDPFVEDLKALSWQTRDLLQGWFLANKGNQRLGDEVHRVLVEKSLAELKLMAASGMKKLDEVEGRSGSNEKELPSPAGGFLGLPSELSEQLIAFLNRFEILGLPSERRFRSLRLKLTLSATLKEHALIENGDLSSGESDRE